MPTYHQARELLSQVASEVKLTVYQDSVIKSILSPIKETILCPRERQVGTSYATGIAMVARAIVPYQNIVFMADGHQQTHMHRLIDELLDKCKNISGLSCIKKTQNELMLSNGSYVRFRSPQTKSIQGYSIDMLIFGINAERDLESNYWIANLAPEHAKVVSTSEGRGLISSRPWATEMIFSNSADSLANHLPSHY
jgi:hypothetical protein